MTPFGDSAVRFPVPPRIAERRALFERLRALPGVRDVVLCEEVGCVVLGEAAPALVRRALEAPIAASEAAVARHVVPVVYDGEDLAAVAATTAKSVEAVVALHREREYVVSMLGFLPGFAYLRGLPRELVLPRRAPRPRVRARSLAIGAEYTGIYPLAAAGGWNLLGRALAAPRFALGDSVMFVSAPDDAPAAPSSDVAAAMAPSAAHLVLTRVAGLALFVDGGRAGRMHEGMPPGGPLVRSDFMRANTRAGNRSAACAVELTGNIEVEARGGATTIADAERNLTLREGERFTLASGPLRARYLAVAGGIDAPIIDGGRGALLAAAIGRPLRRGDVLAPGREDGEARLEPAAPLDERVALLPGPDATPAILEWLRATELTVSPVSDRTGTRLVGPPAPALDAGTRASAPMIEGAIELTPSGLVVLGPDHPTTGGYPVVAIVRARSRDAFFARPLGAPVRFSA